MCKNINEIMFALKLRSFIIKIVKIFQLLSP